MYISLLDDRRKTSFRRLASRSQKVPLQFVGSPRGSSWRNPTDLARPITCRDEGLPIDFPISTPNWSLVSSHVIPCHPMSSHVIPCHVAMSRSSNSAMYEPAKMCRAQVALMSILTHATWLQKVQKDDFWGAIYLFSY